MHPKASGLPSATPVPQSSKNPLLGVLPADLDEAAAALHLAISDYAERCSKLLMAQSIEEEMRLRAGADWFYAQAVRDFALQIVDHADARRPRCA